MRNYAVVLLGGLGVALAGAQERAWEGAWTIRLVPR
jgi:hypothetical protein